ncbi:unnamed protein product [Pocillopora meandrina]|uniref:Uncharacterized protein n=1 Tax=Pocillopora meandrina TaxID=46732 RepID=A0AAU9Y6P1_9CNID|nr:unnamed protein product [Pocillopora meandrina]
MLIAVRKINACKLPPRTIECRNYAKYNPSAFCDDLRDIPWDDVLKERNVNTAWSNWKELFLNVCDRHAPYKRKIVRGVKCPWLTGETKKLMNQRDFFLRKVRRSGAEALYQMSGSRQELFLCTNQVDGKLWTITGPSRSYQ